MSDIGFSLKRNDTLTVVENSLKEFKHSYLFKAGKLDWKWYCGFMRKYVKNIRERKAISMKPIRAVTSQHAITDEWFTKGDDVYREHNLNEKPFHLFNFDEIGLKFE